MTDGYRVSEHLLSYARKLDRRPFTEEQLLMNLKKFQEKGIVGTPDELEDEYDIDIVALFELDSGYILTGHFPIISMKMKSGKLAIQKHFGEQVYYVSGYPLSRAPTWKEFRDCCIEAQQWSSRYIDAFTPHDTQGERIRQATLYCLMRKIDNPTWPSPRDFTKFDFDLHRDLANLYIRGESWQAHVDRFRKWASNLPKEKRKFDYLC